jgi:hypothetical protein
MPSRVLMSLSSAAKSGSRRSEYMIFFGSDNNRHHYTRIDVSVLANNLAASYFPRRIVNVPTPAVSSESTRPV